MVKRGILAIVLLLAVGATAATVVLTASAARNRTACPVTEPNNRPLPGLFGNGRLAVVAYQSIEVTPRTLMPNGWIGEKFPWRAYHGVAGTLKISGRRLDRKARPLRASVSPGAAPASEHTSAFWAVGVMFPTVGCWTITGRVSGASLTVVTRVVDPLGLTKHKST